MGDELFEHRWAMPWKELARSADNGQHASPDHMSALAVMQARAVIETTEANRALVAQTRRLVWATAAMALTTLVLAVVTVCRG
jgi:hypothetical protein